MINQIELLYKARFYSIHFRSDESSKIMALNFIAKAPANFLRFSQPRLKTFVKYAKVELTPPSPGELGQVMTTSSFHLSLTVMFRLWRELQDWWATPSHSSGRRPAWRRWPSTPWWWLRSDLAVITIWLWLCMSRWLVGSSLENVLAKVHLSDIKSEQIRAVCWGAASVVKPLVYSCRKKIILLIYVNMTSFRLVIVSDTVRGM